MLKRDMQAKIDELTAKSHFKEARIKELESKCDMLSGINRGLERRFDMLLDIMDSAAKEGNFPRRPAG